MRQTQWIMLAGCLAFTMAGCASEETPPEAASPPPSPPAAVSPAPVASPKPTASPTPTADQRPNQPAPISGLIPSTNVEEQERQVDTRERTGKTTDPFSALPPDPTQVARRRITPQVAQLPEGQLPNDKTGASPDDKTGASPDGQTSPKAGSSPGTKVQTKEVETPTIPKNQAAPLGVKLPPLLPPLPIAAQPNSPQLPSKPLAETAMAVEVTGVALVGLIPQAIVVAPGDVTSRYVRPGERISGGKVLVKRIEIGNASDPVVVLEENGVEVTKTVGEKPPAKDQKTAA